MKNLMLLMGILLAGTCALAQGTGSSSDTSGSSGASGKATASQRSEGSSQGKTKEKVTADVIASDETAKTITVRPAASSSAESFTLPVEGKAVASLKSIKSGERVDLTCRYSSSSADPNGSTAGSSGTGPSSGADSAGSLISGDRIENPSDSSSPSASKCAAVTAISKAKATKQD